MNLDQHLLNEITNKLDLPKTLFSLRGRNIPTLYMKPVDEEVETTILSYKRKTSIDVDTMSMFSIQKNMKYINKPLVHIFNLFFETREFHSKMKVSKVLPIFKNGKKEMICLVIALFLYYHRFLKY